MSPAPVRGALAVAACMGAALAAWILFEKRLSDAGDFDTVFSNEKMEEKSPPA